LKNSRTVTKDRFWLKAAVQLSVAGCSGRKIADRHEGPVPTQSGLERTGENRRLSLRSRLLLPRVALDHHVRSQALVPEPLLQLWKET
jgi:hypothetical protein